MDRKDRANRGTTLQQIELALQAMEARYRLIVETANEGIWTLDAHNHTDYINPRGAEILGCFPDEILGRSPIEFLFPEDQPSGAQQLFGLAQGISSERTLRVRRQDGSACWVSSSSKPIFDADGKYSGAIAIFQDITERKRAEEQLAFHAFLLEHVNEAVIAIDPQFHITYWNAGAERLYGWTSAEALGQSMPDFVHSQVSGADRTHIVEDLSKSDASTGEAIHHRKDGQPLCIEWNTLILRDGAGAVTGYVSVTRDITARKQVEGGLAHQATLLDFAHDAVLIRDLREVILFWSLGAEELYGWKREEALGKISHALLQTIFPQPVSEIEAEIRRTGYWEGRLVHVTRDGRRFSVTSRWFLQRDTRGNPIAILEANNEIAEPKRAAELTHMQADRVVHYAEDIKRFALDMTRYAADMRQSAEERKQRAARLEQRVRERTAELEAANAELEQEIARRKRIEQELREAEQKANDLVRYAPTAIFEIDVRGLRFTTVNDAMCEMTGYSRDELLATNPFDLFDVDSQQRFRACMGKMFAGEPVDESVAYRVRPKDGRDMVVLLKTRLIRQDGKPIRAFVIAHDITERTHAEQALQTAHERTREVLESIQDGFYALDREWRFTYVNARAALNVHLSAAELIGQNIWEKFPALRATAREVNYRKALDEQVPVHFEMEGILTNASYVIRVYPSADGISVYWLDITERKLNELKIQNLNRDLERQKVELEAANHDLESFSYSVSHDLRAPLASIDGLTSTILKDYGPQLPPETTRLLQLARENTDQMSGLIEALLLLSRTSRQILARQTVAPRQVVEDVVKMLQPQLQGREVEIRIKELPSCQADPVLLRQVYANLLSNAVKFTRNCATTRIEVGHKMVNGETIYFVKDDGVGFDMEQAGKLFGVFQRLHSEDEYEGTGIGLAIVQRIIRRHGGRVWAEGQVGEGATFYFTMG